MVSSLCYLRIPKSVPQFIAEDRAGSQNHTELQQVECGSYHHWSGKQANYKGYLNPLIQKVLWPYLHV